MDRRAGNTGFKEAANYLSVALLSINHPYSDRYIQFGLMYLAETARSGDGVILPFIARLVSKRFVFNKAVAL